MRRQLLSWRSPFRPSHHDKAYRDRSETDSDDTSIAAPPSMLIGFGGRPVVRFALAMLAPRVQRVVHHHAVLEHFMVVGEVVR